MNFKKYITDIVKNKEKTAEKYLGAVSGNLTDLTKKQNIYRGDLSSIKDPNLFNSIMNVLEENSDFIKQDEKGNKMYSNALHHYSNYLELMLEHNIEKINKNKKIKPTTKEAIIQSRIGQGKFRNDLLKYWKKCSVTGCKTNSLLVASHIKPWSNSDDNEKLDKFNGLLLLSNIDKAFDSGLITFDDNGKIIISSHFVNSEKAFINHNMKINLDNRHKPYLEYHREEKFLK